MENFTKISEVPNFEGKEISVRGWIYRTRSSKTTAFLVIRDVSGTVQCVIKEDNPKFLEAKNAMIESSVQILGIPKKDERAPGGFELQITKFELIGPAEVFPITKDQSEEFLMDKRHLWIRSRKLTESLKVRSTVFAAIHDFFRKREFFEVQAPSFTPCACEGGSSVFEVKYFDTKAYLTQSWQLYAEAMIASLEKIYCIAPSFRAEKSRTTRHLTEYWHAETEVAWAHLDDILKLAEEFVSHICQYVAEHASESLKQLGRDPEDLKKITVPFPKITYKEALEILKKDGMEVPWGKDLRTLEERQLMTHYDRPLIITHYPKETMAFYKPKDPKNPSTALCFDMICHDIGELIGGSERETDIEEMKKALQKDGEKVENYEWYFDSRRFGSVPHSGFGFGVERFIQWVCKLDHIRDAIPFPRFINRVSP